MTHTEKELKLAELLDIDIEYISNIADEDSDTLQYLINEVEKLED